MLVDSGACMKRGFYFKTQKLVKIWDKKLNLNNISLDYVALLSLFTILVVDVIALFTQ